ncbi:IS66 family transposase [Zooshikella ganghwensis]|uniref:IS66 family transposase n=1 Tax=Zooshikella ganghwensis TaxID=202772 RepID=UPI000426002A|nr:IS66 family transposase [Zooshikella ganghwensis]
MKSPKIEKLTAEDFSQLKQVIEQSNLSDGHKMLVIGVLELCLWLQQKLTFSQISISNLKKAFGIQSEKHSRGTKPSDTDDLEVSAEDESSQDESTEASQSESSTNTTDKPKRPGHGRLPASAYTAAETISLDHPDYKTGDPCPTQCGGKLYQIKTPGVFIRIEGGQLFNAYRYEQKRLRCAVCGEIFKASLPVAVTEKYDERAKAMVTVLKYQLGMPFYRLAQWQQQTGVPIPDTTQWELCVDAHQVATYVFNACLILGAQSPLFFQDDTTVKVQSVMTSKEVNPDKSDKKGTFTTGLVADHQGHPIYLFFSGVKNAGNNLTDVLNEREEDLPIPFQACDALSQNNVDKALKTIVCHCLIHGRRKFVELEDSYPDEAKIVLDTVGQVYANEAHCKNHRLSPEDRLTFHQEKSKPLLEEMKQWMERQLAGEEPKTPLAKSYRYWLKRWDTLTRFLTHVGAPLDTNTVERALKLAIRIRKSSLFHKTLNGAKVGSELMSVIHTALKNGINPIDYLTALQQHQAQVKQDPFAWLPWNYQQTLQALAEETPLAA